MAGFGRRVVVRGSMARLGRIAGLVLGRVVADGAVTFFHAADLVYRDTAFAGDPFFVFLGSAGSSRAGGRFGFCASCFGVVS